MSVLNVLLIILLLCASGIAQTFQSYDRAVYSEVIPGFYQDSILKSLDGVVNDQETTRMVLGVDLAHYSFPTNPGDYRKQWHNQPVSQGSTGTCWSYAAVSLIESEAYRISGKKVKLSEMYIVYWEYLARAEYFVEKRGKMNLGEGSASNAVTRMMKMHGIVPESIYPGKPKGKAFHDHRKMFEEIRTYFNAIQKDTNWNRDLIVSTVKSILNHHMGEPPALFSFEGQEYTPLSFMTDYIRISPDDYFSFMSTTSKTFNQKGKFEQPDNWWGSGEYYNVTLADFMTIMKDALDKGFTFSICGDVSEPGYDKYAEVGIIPTFDIPAAYINEDSRELRMYNKATTDDHCIHFIGYLVEDGLWWFMIKDSGSGAFDGPHKGYRFIREDYVSLKVMAVMVHKEGARRVLDKIIK
jgi:bleomycin hydrolase